MKIETKNLNIKLPTALIEEITQYQSQHVITSLGSAVFELVRSGLAAGPGASSQKTFNPGLETKNVPMRVPIPLLDQIEKYQSKNFISTRTNAFIELIRIGLSD